MSPVSDSARMRTALALGRQALGTTWPNPAVGCVILDPEGHPAGHGATGRGGRPHAELRALAQAAQRARGGTAFVTLEPCAHEGDTPSCARELVEASVARVVIGVADPDPRTNGSGTRLLTDAGIAVTSGCCESEARRLHLGHLRRIETGRPQVTLKLATSLDGRIATATGASRWLTGTQARQHAHLLRARHDAVLVGAGTAIDDQPQLTCRLPGLAARSPVRIVVVGGRRTVPEGSLFINAGNETEENPPLWLIVTPDRRGTVKDLEQAGAEVLEVAAGQSGRPSLQAALEALGSRGLTSVLVEGGQEIATALLANRLVDTVVWYSTDAVLGGDGLAALGPLGRQNLADSREFRTISERWLGSDHVRFLEPVA